MGLEEDVGPGEEEDGEDEGEGDYACILLRVLRCLFLWQPLGS